MKLRAITLTNVRRFLDPVTIDGIGDGLNVLSQPNEFGKSTLFDALQAMFFKAHGSKDRGVKALQPHAGGAPEVSVEIETDAGRFTLSKRWLSKPEARVEQAGRLIAQADAAEDWIARVLGGVEGGPSGLLWVRQGMTGLTSGTRKEDEQALEARRDLMSSVSHEVEAMTGGRRMDAALARCRGELAVLATSTGRPRASGPWKDAQDRVEMLETEAATLSDTARALHDALDTRRRLRRELAEIEDPEATAARAARLTEAVEAQAEAARHAERVEAAQRKLDSGRIALARARDRLQALRDADAEAKGARAALEVAEAAHRRATADCDAARKDAGAAQRALDSALADEKAAETARRAADRRRAARDGAARKADLADRIVRAETARRAMEGARATASRGPDAAMMRKLDGLAAALHGARAARDASVPQVVVRYDAGGTDLILLNGAPAPEGRALPISRATTLQIVGVGALDIQPTSDLQSDEAVQRAESALSRALGAVGCSDLDQARTDADSRASAARELGEAQAIFDSLAPDGLDPLRTALAAIPDPDDDPEADSDPQAADDRYQHTMAVRLSAQSDRESSAERLSHARSAVAGANAALGAARDRLARAETGLAKLGDVDDAGLSAAFQSASTAVQSDTAVLADLGRGAPDLGAAEAALTRARSVEDAARAAQQRLRLDIARLDERIARAAGDAVEERLAETRERLTRARRDLNRIAHEVAVLRRLDQALEAAKTEARDRYFAPVAAELRPLLSLLWPEADLTWAQDTLLPTALIRDGREEPIDILSGGTQEQVALLVRLAFARMLARAGRHAPVILDDALVFTDDDRIERMFDALHRQAGDLQIIVLSCRQRAFRDLGGRVLTIGG